MASATQLGRSKTPTAEQLRSPALHTQDSLRDRLNMNGMNSGNFYSFIFAFVLKKCVNVSFVILKVKLCRDLLSRSHILKSLNVCEDKILTDIILVKLTYNFCCDKNAMEYLQIHADQKQSFTYPCLDKNIPIERL